MDEVEIYLSEHSDLTVNGDFDLTTTLAKNNDDFVNWDIDGDARATITGDLTFHLDEASNACRRFQMANIGFDGANH